VIAAGYSPNRDTFVPILTHLLLRRDHVAFMHELELMPVELVPAVYIPVARKHAVSELLRRVAVEECAGVLMDIERMGGAAAVTRAFNEGLENACAQGLGAQCLEFLPLIRKGLINPDGYTYAAVANCLSTVRPLLLLFSY
jgi:hypothetical protein